MGGVLAKPYHHARCLGHSIIHHDRIGASTLTPPHLDGFHRPMKAILRIILPLLVLACLLNSALAGLDIKLARYGDMKNYRDVRKVIEAYVRSNTLSIPIDPKSMGGDPNPGRKNFLYIEYEVNGRELKGSTSDGGVFTFQGIAGVRPPVQLPIIRRPVPTTSQLRIVNRSGAPVTVYSIDRHGSWSWAQSVSTGDSFNARAQVGQDWVMTDTRQQVLEQYRVRSGDNTVVLHPRYQQPGPGTPTRVRFENGNRRVLNLYNLDRWGGWNWMARLEPSGIYGAATLPGEKWVATDTANAVVKQVTIEPGMARVPLR